MFLGRRFAQGRGPWRPGMRQWHPNLGPISAFMRQVGNPNLFLFTDNMDFSYGPPRFIEHAKFLGRRYALGRGPGDLEACSEP